MTGSSLSRVASRAPRVGSLGMTVERGAEEGKNVNDALAIFFGEIAEEMADGDGVVVDDGFDAGDGKPAVPNFELERASDVRSDLFIIARLSVQRLNEFGDVTFPCSCEDLAGFKAGHVRQFEAVLDVERVVIPATDTGDTRGSDTECHSEGLAAPHALLGEPHNLAEIKHVTRIHHVGSDWLVQFRA